MYKRTNFSKVKSEKKKKGRARSAIELALKKRTIYFTYLNFGPGSFQSCHGYHIETSNDTHERIEVANVDTLACHFDPEFNGFHSEFLFLSLTNSGGY